MCFPRRLGKTLCEQLVDIKLTITFRDLKIDWNQFLHYFWRQVPSENVRGQLNKKFAKLDEIGIGSGRDYKAGLICLFTVFTKKCLWQGNWFKLYSTTDVKKTMKSYGTDFRLYGIKYIWKRLHSYKRNVTIGAMYSVCITLRVKLNSTAFADKKQRVITWDLRSFSDERNLD